MKIITTEPAPIKMWLDDIEDGALSQARNLAKLPFVFRWIALMPDCHQGFGMPIGGVLAAQDAIVPNAVGVDIGCGMCAVRSDARNVGRDSIKRIMGKIRERIPVGFEHHSKDRTWNGFQEAPDIPVIMRELNAARRQLGTLGGGNHFIELQRSMSGELWIMIHSGSRNFGLQIAHEYHEIAKDICARKRLEIPEKDLAYLPIGTSEADQYLEAMQFALAFAKQNRLEMIDVVRHAVSEALPGTRFDDVINIHHNYAAKEEHYGRSVFVHRKGATSARTGEIGIIPGSQGTKSYIVRGKGNPESFMSCSHGAGRKMGRKQAMRELSLAKEKLRMDEMGIVHGIRTAKDLDEAPGAYKDIERVMANQADLVEIVEELVPLAVIKG